jgi:hypothetical protein
MPLKLCLVIVVLGLSAGNSHATPDYTGDSLTQLLGWSQDGIYWGSIVHDYENEGMSVKKGSQRLDRDTCAPMCDIVWKISGHKYAPAGGDKVQKLMPVSAAWRKAFAAKYQISRKNTNWEEQNDSGSRARFRLHRKGKKRSIWETTLNFNDPTEYGTDSLGFVGGYLHPNGQFALLKFRFTTSIGNDVERSTRFEFVDLRAAKFCGKRYDRHTTEIECSEASVSNLKPVASVTALTSLKLVGTNVADLTPLAGLTALTYLDLKNTQVSDEQVEQMKKRLPKLRVNH